MDGYFEQPDATESALRGGWYHTGDLGALDEEGYVSIVGRARDVLRTGGETVSPGEVERVLAAHPAVAEVAVVGVPDARWGDVVCAVVVPAAGRGHELSVESLRAALRRPPRPVQAATPARGRRDAAPHPRDRSDPAHPPGRAAEWAGTELTGTTARVDTPPSLMTIDRGEPWSFDAWHWCSRSRSPSDRPVCWAAPPWRPAAGAARGSSRTSSRSRRQIRARTPTG